MTESTIPQGPRVPPSIWRNPWHFLAFGFGSGAMRKAPGTWGSAAGLLWWALVVRLAHAKGGPHEFIFDALVVMMAILVCGVAAAFIGKKDPSEIILDEFAAMPLVFLFNPYVTGGKSSLLFILLGFLLFRLFDITKPFGIKALEKLFGQVQDLSDTFYAGDLAGAFDRAMALDMDGEQLASMSLRLTQTTVRQATDAYGAVAGQGASAVNAGLQDYAQGLLDALRSAEDLAQDAGGMLKELLKGGFSLDERFDLPRLEKAESLNRSLLDGLQSLLAGQVGDTGADAG